MLTLAASLPPGALIGGEAATLSKALSPTGGIWLSATPEALVNEGNGITGWRDTTGNVTATAVDPNTGHSRFHPGPPAGLLCETGVNCGFVIPDFVPKVERFTAAAIYSSPKGEARTVVAVRTGASRNVIFLNETEGALFATDRDGSVSVSLPLSARPGQPRLVVLSYTSRGIILRAGGLTQAAEGRVPDMAHPGQFLIGCRSNRSGLAKTLGQLSLHDVIFWPDRALLASTLAEDQAALAALDSYHRWAV